MRARVALFALLVACRAAPTATGPPGTATIDHTVDGDTVIVRISGRTETVRLLGIDTPETKDPRRPVECFGPEASARTKELLPKGTIVRLERDVEARDRYGRLLAYVFRASDDLFVNRTLLDEGYAEPFPFEPNVAYSGDLAAAADAARSAGRGLWGTCEGL